MCASGLTEIERNNLLKLSLLRRRIIARENYMMALYWGSLKCFSHSDKFKNSISWIGMTIRPLHRSCKSHYLEELQQLANKYLDLDKYKVL